MLLDEIDKADSELPNSLLEVLENNGFRKPWGTDEIKPYEGKKPLIIITTNEDRELPPAFVRRCLVLNIVPDGNFTVWVKNRARVHFRNPDQQKKAGDRRPALTEIVLNQAAEQLEQDRNNNAGEGPQPGLAEYLDLLRGLLQELAEDNEAEQLRWLKRVYQFAYHKQPTSN